MENKLDENEISVSVSEEENCRKVISVEIAQDRFSTEKEKVLRSFVKKASLPGFRKGKAPADLVKRRFAEQIEAETLKKILPLAYGHLVSSEKLEPIGEPVFSDIKSEDDEPLSFRVDVEVFPEIGDPEYRGINVEAEEITVEEEEIGSVLDNLQEREAEYVAVERPAVTSDLVILDYAPVGLDDKINEERFIKDYPVQLGSGQLFPAFEEAVAGKPAGATARVEIEYPEDYKPEHLASRKVMYEFTIKEVKEKRVHPLNDEFAQRVDPKMKDMDELREDIKLRLIGEKEREAERRREEEAIDILIEHNPFDVPMSMLERYKKELHEENERRRSAMGAEPVEDEEKKRQLEDFIEKMALRNIRKYFLMEHIAGIEEITVTDEDVNGELEKISGEHEKDIEEVKKVFAPGSEYLKNLKGRLRERKIFNVILGEARKGGGAV